MYDNLKVLMSRKNITNEVLARLLGVHRDTIANKLAGESEFTYGQAELILTRANQKELVMDDNGEMHIVSREEASGQLSMFNTYDEYKKAMEDGTY